MPTCRHAPVRRDRAPGGCGGCVAGCGHPALRCGRGLVRLPIVQCTRQVAGRCGHRPLRGNASNPGANRNPVPGGHTGRLSVSKKSFRHAVRIFKLSKKFKNTCRLNAKGAFCPLHTSPAALSQTSSARFFDSPGRPYRPPLQRAAHLFPIPYSLAAHTFPPSHIGCREAASWLP